jgi:hypothetical protein
MAGNDQHMCNINQYYTVYMYTYTFRFTYSYILFEIYLYYTRITRYSTIGYYGFEDGLGISWHFISFSGNP